jgi:hypothetical protein
VFDAPWTLALGETALVETRYRDESTCVSDQFEGSHVWDTESVFFPNTLLAISIWYTLRQSILPFPGMQI